MKIKFKKKLNQQLLDKKMYDSGKIFLGIMVFVAFFTYPIWFNLSGGESGKKPVLAYPEGEDKKECVESSVYMRAFHMDLLNDWRDKVVREGQRAFTSSTGKKFEMSVTKTCLGCHSDKVKFCDECHNYLQVTPYCWDCHIEPGITEIR